MDKAIASWLLIDVSGGLMFSPDSVVCVNFKSRKRKHIALLWVERGISLTYLFYIFDLLTRDKNLANT